MAKKNIAKLLKFKTVHDPRGDLTVLESGNEVPFPIQRVYYIYNVTQGSGRGGHAHKNLKQVLIALSGSFTVDVNDGSGVQSYFLNNPQIGLLLDRLVWREIVDFSKGAVCLCLASRKYDPDDYIRDYQDFLRRAEVNANNTGPHQNN